MNGLIAWLERLELGQYAQVMADNDVDLDILRQLSDDDLKELGLSLGHRRKLLAWATPGRGKIHEDGDIGFEHLLLEILVRECKSQRHTPFSLVHALNVKKEAGVMS